MLNVIKKYSTLIIWSASLSAILLFIDLIGNSNPTLLERWVKISASIFIGGLGFNHLILLFKTQYTEFYPDNLYSILIILLGFLLAFFGILLNGNQTFGVWWNLVGLGVILLSLYFIFFGSAIAKTK